MHHLLLGFTSVCSMVIPLWVPSHCGQQAAGVSAAAQPSSVPCESGLCMQLCLGLVCHCDGCLLPSYSCRSSSGLTGRAARHNPVGLCASRLSC